MSDPIENFLNSWSESFSFSFTFRNMPYRGEVRDILYLPRCRRDLRILKIKLNIVSTIIANTSGEKIKLLFDHRLIINGGNVEVRGRELIISYDRQVNPNYGPVMSLRKLYNDTIYTT